MVLDFLFPKENPVIIKERYNIPDKVRLSFELTKDGWFLVTSPDLPGLITQARDQKELLEMVNDAILTYFDVPENECSEVFDKIHLEGFGAILSEKAKKVLATN